MDIYCKSDRKQHPSCAGTIENGSAYLHFSKPVASLLVMENADIRTHFLSFFGAGGNNYSFLVKAEDALGAQELLRDSER